MGHVSAVGLEREAKKRRQDRSQHAGIEIQGPSKKEQDKEAGMMLVNAKLGLLKFIPLHCSCAEHAINL